MEADQEDPGARGMCTFSNWHWVKVSVKVIIDLASFRSVLSSVI